MQLIRRQRDKLLADSDWVILRHRDEQERELPTTLDASQYRAWLDYRQALRDLPNCEQFDPWNVVWPVAPFAGGS